MKKNESLFDVLEVINIWGAKNYGVIGILEKSEFWASLCKHDTLPKFQRGCLLDNKAKGFYNEVKKKGG